MTLELPVIPTPGEVFLAVELTAVQNMTVAQTLGYWKIWATTHLCGIDSLQMEGFCLYALLRHDFVNPEILQNSDYLGEQLDALAEVIEPFDAITSPRGISSAKTPAVV